MIRSILLMLLAIVLIAVLAIPILVLNTIRKLFRRENIAEYLFTVAIGFDQAGGSILYGQEDWTVSSWTYILSRRGNKSAKWFMIFIDLFFGKNHCEKSYLWESIKQGGRE